MQPPVGQRTPLSFELLQAAVYRRGWGPDGRREICDFAPSMSTSDGVYPYHRKPIDLAQVAPTGKAFAESYKRRALRFLSAGIPPAAVVLEVGCANCEILDLFPSTALRIGVDVSAESMFGRVPNALDTAVDQLWLADAAKLPLPDEVVDLALCCDLLEHLVRPEAVLAELRRVVRPGGRILVTTPNLVHYGNRLSFLFGSGVGLELAQIMKFRSPWIPISGPRFPDQRLHLRWFTRRSLCRFLAENGLRVRKCFGIGPVVTRCGLGPWLSGGALLLGALAEKQ